MTMIRREKKLQNCTENDYFFNKWTFAIVGLFILMAASVTLAIIFPYQGDDLMVDDDDEDSSGSNDVLLTSEELSSSLLEREDEHHNSNNNIGLFDSAVTTTDEQGPPPPPQQGVSSSSLSLSTCQMELQQADSNGDKLIDSTEYITFLHNNNKNDVVVDSEKDTILSPSITQFEELPNEYQLNFVHLAGSTAGDGGGGGADDVVVGISISSIEEMQKVCLYISNKGSSALGEFDWSQISSSSP